MINTKLYLFHHYSYSMLLCPVSMTNVQFSTLFESVKALQDWGKVMQGSHSSMVFSICRMITTVGWDAIGLHNFGFLSSLKPPYIIWILRLRMLTSDNQPLAMESFTNVGFDTYHWTLEKSGGPSRRRRWSNYFGCTANLCSIIFSFYEFLINILVPVVQIFRIIHGLANSEHIHMSGVSPELNQLILCSLGLRGRRTSPSNAWKLHSSPRILSLAKKG